ncbi:MAG: redoxin domain-containing protein, partial [Dehalococcoidia bacterium]
MILTTLTCERIAVRYKRFPVIAAATLTLIFLVAACGSSTTAQPTEPSTTQEQSSNPTDADNQEQPVEATAPVATKSSAANADREAGGAVGDLAPEFGGIAAWINGGPLTMEELRGRVVLIDFWTYTCINCIRTFPFLKQWHARYADDGLVIVGVHSPEFEFEKDYDNVVEATQNDALVWTMAQDNDFITWRRYSNRFWPAKYLIDKDGVVRYTHFGEGGYAETEDVIREL